MFPETGDVLHDWSDDDAVAIIKAAADCIRSSSNSSIHRIIIVYRRLMDGGSFINTFGGNPYNCQNMT
jgi:hypothetical protein